MAAMVADDLKRVAECVTDAFFLPEINSNPYYLPCIHVLCQKCLETIRGRTGADTGDSIVCSICKCDLSLVDVDEKPIAEFASGLLKTFFKVTMTNFACQSCQAKGFSRPADFYCKCCKKHFCNLCRRDPSRSRCHHFSDNISKLLLHSHSDEFKHWSSHSYQEICCTVCKEAGCIVCLIEGDKIASAAMMHDFEEAKKKLSLLSSSLKKMKSQLIIDKKEIECEELVKRQIIDQKKRLDMNYDQLKCEFQEKQKTRTEKESQLHMKLRDAEGHLYSVGRFSSSKTDVVTWKKLCKEMMNLEREVNECSQGLTSRGLTHLEFKASNVVETDNMIGTIEEIDDEVSDHKKKRLLGEDPNKVEEMMNMRQSPSVAGNVRVLNAAETFRTLTVLKVDEGNDCLSTINKYDKRITKTTQEAKEVFQAASRENANAAIASILKILESHIETELKDTQSLYNTATSISGGAMHSKIDHCADQVDDLRDILEKIIKFLAPSAPSISAGSTDNRGQSSMQSPTMATLANLGNTCFLNVIVQVLFHTKIFVKLLGDRGSGADKSLTKAFINLCSLLSSKTGPNTVYPDHLRSALEINLKKFADFNQHDSHDLLIHFLNRVRKEERDDLGSGEKMFDSKTILTAVDEVFGGHILTVFLCHDCKNPYYICEPFLDLSLPIYEQPASLVDHGYQCLAIEEIFKPVNNFQKAIVQALKPFNDSSRAKSKDSIKLENCVASSLQHFTRSEYIDNEYLCKECNAFVSSEKHKLTSATKRTLIYNPPAILTLHLKRFKQESGIATFLKNSQHINFDFFFDIAPFCSSGCLNVDPLQKNIWYQLYAMIVHEGTLNCGHYVVYVLVQDDEPDVKDLLQRYFLDCSDIFSEKTIRKLMDIQKIRQKFKVIPSSEIQKWYRFSDSWCDVVKDITDILQQEAYMLFYQRVPATS